MINCSDYKRHVHKAVLVGIRQNELKDRFAVNIVNITRMFV